MIEDQISKIKDDENSDGLAWILIKRGGTVANVLSLRNSLTSTLYLVWPPAAFTTSSSASPKSPKVIVITMSGNLLNGNTTTVMLVTEYQSSSGNLSHSGTFTLRPSISTASESPSAWTSGYPNHKSQKMKINNYFRSLNESPFFHFYTYLVVAILPGGVFIVWRHFESEGGKRSLEMCFVLCILCLVFCILYHLFYVLYFVLWILNQRNKREVWK